MPENHHIVSKQTATQGSANANNAGSAAVSLPAVRVSKGNIIEEGPLQFMRDTPGQLMHFFAPHQSVAGNSTINTAFSPVQKKEALNQPAIIQRFKKKKEDAAEVTEGEIESAPLEELEDWVKRVAPEVDDWEEIEEAEILVPTAAEKVRIQARIDKLKADKAAAAKLLRLGVTQPELDLFESTTKVERTIIAAAQTAKANGWDITAILTSMAAADQDARNTAILVLAKGEVTTQQSVIDVALNWSAFQLRDAINVDVLVRLITDKAVIFEGGEYSEGSLTGTSNRAYTFYANAVQKLRIDPEWHVHVALRGDVIKPGFKKHSDKMNTGPGTRRETDTAETTKLKTALGLS